MKLSVQFDSHVFIMTIYIASEGHFLDRFLARKSSKLYSVVSNGDRRAFSRNV